MKTGLLATLSLAVASLNVIAQKAYFAPTPPPIIYSSEKPKASADASANVAQAAVQFSVGDPTDEEQLHLELINRARANANAEAQRLIELAITDPDVNDQFFRAWNVDTNLMKAQFSTNPPVAPLSFNAKLINAARGHSQYQFDNAVQSHDEPNPLTANPGLRATAAGYLYSSLGENVFLNATSVQQGHAAFDVDWGPGPGGMQTPPGHRNTIHSGSFIEVGIGVIKGSNSVNGNEAGPQVVTEDFGAPRTGATRYITGVAYYDINGNNFYDLGEGLPDVRVTVDGVSTFAITTTSGAYSIPVPANATYVVRFNSSGAPEYMTVATVGTANKKVDHNPPYVVPTATGPATAFTGVGNVYDIAALPGATGYRARVTQLGPLPVEGAEGALDNLTITTFGGYPYVSTTRKASGAKSFHLGHMVDNGSIDPQIIAFNEPIHVGANARVDFKSLLGFAGSGEIAEFQVSEDNGATWTTLWSQAGDGSEETQFSANTASLDQYANKTVHVRFVFDFVGGQTGILPDPSDPSFDHVGWFLDDIAFTNADAVVSGIESDVLSEPRFIFRPTTTGTYFLEFQAISGARTFPYGPAQQVTVNANPPVVSFVNNMAVTPTTVLMSLVIESGNPTSFALESAPTVNGPWTRETQAQFTPSMVDTVHYAITVPHTADTHFYRLMAN